jgi:hypothetical protein
MQLTLYAPSAPPHDICSQQHTKFITVLRMTRFQKSMFVSIDAPGLSSRRLISSFRLWLIFSMKMYSTPWAPTPNS